MATYWDDSKANNLEQVNALDRLWLADIVITRDEPWTTDDFVEECRKNDIYAEQNADGELTGNYYKMIKSTAESVGKPVYDALEATASVITGDPYGVKFTNSHAVANSEHYADMLNNYDPLIRGMDTFADMFNLAVDKDSTHLSDMIDYLTDKLTTTGKMYNSIMKWDYTLNGIASYVDVEAYNAMYDYLRENHLLPILVNDYVDGYNADTQMFTFRNSGGTGVLYTALTNWLRITDIGTRYTIPSVEKITQAMTDAIANVTRRCDTGHPNIIKAQVYGSASFGAIDIDVSGCYVTNGATIHSYPNWRERSFSLNDINGVHSSKVYTVKYRCNVQYGETEFSVNAEGTETSIPASQYLSLHTRGSGASTAFEVGTLNMREEVEDIDTPLTNLPLTRGTGTPRVIRATDGQAPTTYWGGGGADQNTADGEGRLRPKYPDGTTGDTVVIPTYDPITQTTKNKTYVYSKETSDDDVTNRTNIYNYYYGDKDPYKSDFGHSSLPPSDQIIQADGLYKMYNLKPSDLIAFGQWLWSSNIIEMLKTIWQNPLDGVLSLNLVYCKPHLGTAQNIKVGYLNTNISCDVVTSQFSEIDCGTITIDEFYGDARDYPPYSSYSIYLPFIGYRDLDPYAIIGGTLNVKYNIDVLTGVCVCFLTVNRDGSDKVIAMFDGNSSIQIPLTASDRSAILKGAINGIASTVTKAVMGDVKGAIGTGVESAIGVATTGVSIDKSGSISGNAGALSNKKPFLIRSRFKHYEAVGYNNIIGHADNTMNAIGTNDGYCQFTNVKLECNAMGEEYDEILSLLTSGVFI